MKRLILIPLIIVLAAGLVFSGCSEPAPTTPSEPLPEQVVFASASVGSSAYPMIVAASSIMSKYIDGTLVRELPVGPPYAVQESLYTGKAEIAWLTSTTAPVAYRGIGVPKALPVNLMFTGPAGYHNFVALQGKGINTLADLKGKTLAIGAARTEGQLREAILHAFGWTKDDLTMIETANAAEVTRSMIEGIADAGVFLGSVPHAALVELHTARDLVFLSMGKDTRDRIVQYVLENHNSMWNLMTMPANSYEGQTNVVETTGYYHSFGCKPDASEGLIYTLMKALFDH